MSVASEILRIQQAKDSIKTAINEKGGSLTDASKLDSFADAINNLPSGEGGGGNNDALAKGMIEKNITNIVVPDGVTTIGTYAFAYSSKLTSITLPNTLKGINGYAFQNCTSLESIVIPEGVRQLNLSTFQACSKLKSISLPSTLTNLQSSVFQGCSSLTTIELPNVTYMSTSVFQNCSSLQSIQIPNSLTNIPNSTFDGCSKLTTITIPRGVKSIGGTAFQNCTSLTQVTIPDTVTTVNSNAFSGCTALNLVYYDTNKVFANSFTAPPAGQLTFVIRYTGGVISYVANTFKEQTKIVVPKSLFNTYRSNTSWKLAWDYIYWVDDDDYYPGCTLKQTDPDEQW